MGYNTGESILISTNGFFSFAVKVVDNTVTVIILSIIGGIIGFIILVMVMRALIQLIMRKVQEKK